MRCSDSKPFGTAVCDLGQTHQLLHYRGYFVNEPLWHKTMLVVHQRVCCCNHQTGDEQDVNFNLHRLAHNFLPFSSVVFSMKTPRCRSDESTAGAGDPVFLPFLAVYPGQSLPRCCNLSGVKR